MTSINLTPDLQVQIGSDLDATVTGGEAPAVAALPNGQFVVTWESNASIYAQLFNADGSAASAEFVVKAADPNPQVLNSQPVLFTEQLKPTVAALPDGQFVVTWYEFRHILSSGDAYAPLAQVFAADGSPVGSAFDVFGAGQTGDTSGIPQFDINPAVAVLPNSHFVVTENNGLNGGFQVNLLNADGSAIKHFDISSTADANAKVAALPDDQFVVTWQSSDGIHAQRFNADGSAGGNDFIVNTTAAGIEQEPAVTALPDGHFVVTWISAGSVYARVFNADASAVGNDFLVAATGDQPAVTALPGGPFLVTWSSSGDIHARLFDAAGGALGNEFIVNATTAGTQSQPAITMLPDGRLIEVWQSNGEIHTTSLTLLDTNQPAVVGASGGTTAATEQVAVAVDPALTLSDADSATLAFATVSITGGFHSGQDVLAFTNGNAASFGNISAHYDAVHGVLDLWSAGATATVAQWQAALRAVTYTDTSDSPNTSDRTISFSVTDGIDPGTASTKTVSVTAVNDPAVVTASAGATATAAHATVFVDGGITVADVDNTTLASASVSITGAFQSGQDLLAFVNSNAATFGNIAASYDAVHGVLSLTSTGATATLDQWQAALRSVTYTDTSDNPNTSDRTISIAVNDGTDTSTAAIKTVSFTPRVQVQPGTDFSINAGGDLPNVAALPNGQFVVTWQSNDSIYAQLFNSDGNAAGSDFLIKAAEVNNQIVQVGNTTDLLFFTDQFAPTVAALPDGDFVVSWTAFRHFFSAGNDYTVLAHLFTAAGSPVGSDFAAGAFQTNDTLSDVDTFLALHPVAAALPNGNFVVIDGLSVGVLGTLFDPGGNKITSFAANTLASALNWPQSPSIAALPDGDFVVAWSSSDTGDGSDSCIRARLFNADGSPAGNDFIVDTTAAGAQVAPAVAALPDGHFVVTWQSGGDIYARVFNAVGSPLGPDFLVGGNHQAGGPTDPGPGPAVSALPGDQFLVTWSTLDGDIHARVFNSGGAALGPDSIVNSNTAGFDPSITKLPDGHLAEVWWQPNGGISAALLTYTDTNQPPVVSASGGITAASEQVAVAVDPALTLSDADNATLGFAEVSITGGFQSGEDVLAFTNNDAASFGNISASYAAGVLELTSSGATATLAQWQAALRAVTYTDTSDTPHTSNRTISFVVNDGFDDSAAATRTVSVTAVNDPPVVTASAGVTAASAHATVFVDGAVTVADVDSATLASASVSITGAFQAGQDLLAFVNDDAASFGNISASYDAVHGVLSLTSSGATATLAQWQAALRAVTYTDTSDNPDTSNRTISFAVNDGTDPSTASTKTVAVSAPPPPPAEQIQAGSDLAVTGVGTNETPAVAALPNDQLVVTWEASSNIYAQLLNADGSVSGGAILVKAVGGHQTVGVFPNISIVSETDQLKPTVAALPDGHFVVTWYSDHVDAIAGDFFDVHAQLFAADGSLIGGDLSLTGALSVFGGGSLALDPTVAALPNDDFVVTWNINGGAAGGLFNASGGKLADLTVNTIPTLGADPSVAALPNGNFVVTWFSSDGGDGSGSCVRARLFNANGTAVGNDFIVDTTTPGNQQEPAVTALPDGHFVVTWVSNGSIYARLFNADASPVGNDFIVAAAGDQPTVTALPDGHFAVTWSSNGDIHARLFDTNGGGSNDIIVNSTTAGDQNNPATATLPDGRIAEVWQSDGEIRAAFVSVSAGNHAPTANPDSATTDEDHPILVAVLANDTDPDAGDHLGITAASITNGALGSLAIAADGQSITYNPAGAYNHLAAGESAAVQVGYDISDGHGGTAHSIATIIVQGVNDAPAANPDSATTDEDHPISVAVLANDTDPDSSDHLSVTAASIINGGLGAVTVAAGGQSVTYNPAGAYNHLAAGESATVQVGYDISDGHGGTAHAVATITVTGVNDPPSVEALAGDSAGTATPLLADGSGQHASGTVTVTDSDPDDTDTITTSLRSHTGPTGALSEADLAGYFQASPNSIAHGGSAHDVTWTFDSGAQNFAYLAQNETLTLQYNIDATDSSNARGEGVITVRIQGTNADPVLAADTVASHGVSERAHQTNDTIDPDGTSGVLSFTDPNWSDTHTASAGLVSAVWSGAGTNAIPAATQAALATALTDSVAPGKDSQNGATGTVDWGFSLPDNLFDFLAWNETLTLKYDVAVSDHFGGTSTEPVTIVVTGANDAPTIDIVHSSFTGSTSELPLTTGSNAVDPASGTIAFTDVDLNDRPTASIGTQSVVWSDTSNHTFALTAAQIAAFEADFTVTGEAGNANNGIIDWKFGAVDKTLDFLGANESLTITSQVTVSDGHGGSDSQNVAVTVHGANDAPVVGWAYAGCAKNASISADAAHGALANASDPDAHDQLSLSVSSVQLLGSQSAAAVSANHPGVVQGTYGQLTLNADGSYGYVANKGALPAQIVPQDIFTYAVSDGHGGTTTAELTITLFGSGVTYTQANNIPGSTLATGNGQGALDGGDANHTLIGGNGADWLLAGRGDDTLTGGNGPDTFAFGPHIGKDVITDFNASNDVIQISHALFANYAAVLGAESPVNGGHDTVITHYDDHGNVDGSVTLLGTALSSLHASNFLFV